MIVSVDYKFKQDGSVLCAVVEHVDGSKKTVVGTDLKKLQEQIARQIQQSNLP